MTIIKETAKNIAKTIGKIAGEDKLASELTLGYEAFEGFALAELLTEHLRTVSRNPDYKVEYDPQNPAKMVREDGIVVEGVSTSYSKSGIENLEILSGDVGYINISHFGPKNQSASTFKAAMSVLQYTSALIIDLRKTLHVTGSGDSANELLSYFTSKNIQYKYVKWANKRPKRERSLKKVPGLRYNGDGLRRRAVYVLTSVETISTAEAFSHFMKMLGLAKVVGEATLGSCQSAVRIQRCGHNDFKVYIPGQVRFVTDVPGWKGVIPDIETEPQVAKEQALLEARKVILGELGRDAGETSGQAAAVNDGGTLDQAAPGETSRQAAAVNDGGTLDQAAAGETSGQAAAVNDGGTLDQAAPGETSRQAAAVNDGGTLDQAAAGETSGQAAAVNDGGTLDQAAAGETSGQAAAVNDGGTLDQAAAGETSGQAAAVNDGRTLDQAAAGETSGQAAAVNDGGTLDQAAAGETSGQAAAVNDGGTLDQAAAGETSGQAAVVNDGGTLDQTAAGALASDLATDLTDDITMEITHANHLGPGEPAPVSRSTSITAVASSPRNSESSDNPVVSSEAPAKIGATDSSADVTAAPSASADAVATSTAAAGTTVSASSTVLNKNSTAATDSVAGAEGSTGSISNTVPNGDSPANADAVAAAAGNTETAPGAVIPVAAHTSNRAPVVEKPPVDIKEQYLLGAGTHRVRSEDNTIKLIRVKVFTIFGITIRMGRYK